jgi:hypothetical protein
VPGFYRLVRGELHKLMPGHIRDAPVDDFVSFGLHPRNIQILKGDELIGIHQLAALLMREILTPVGLSPVGMLQSVNYFLALRAALLQFLFLALQAGDVLSILFHPALALDFVAIRKNGKGGQAKINANDLIDGWQGTVNNFARERGEPVPHAVTPDGERFYCSFNWAMLNNLHHAYFRKEQPVIEQIETRLFECETVIAPKTLKAGEPGRFFSSLYPAKEGLKRQINTLLCVLKHLGMRLRQFWLVRFPAGQELIGIVQRERLLFLLPGVLAGCQCLVIHPTARIQRFVEQGSLVSGWAKAKLEGFPHRTIVLYLGCLEVA